MQKQGEEWQSRKSAHANELEIHTSRKCERQSKCNKRLMYTLKSVKDIGHTLQNALLNMHKTREIQSLIGEKYSFKQINMTSSPPVHIGNCVIYGEFCVIHLKPFMRLMHIFKCF